MMKTNFDSIMNEVLVVFMLGFDVLKLCKQPIYFSYFCYFLFHCQTNN